MKRRKINNIVIDDYQIKIGDYLTCSNKGLSSLTINKQYKVLNTFTYENTYKSGKYRDYFVIIRNDNGMKSKVNINRFDILNHIKSLNRVKSIENILKNIEGVDGSE
jgi:hypothetical protein